MAIQDAESMLTGNSSMTGAGRGVLAEAYTLLLISSFFVSIRCFGQIRKGNAWTWDNTTIVLALIFFILTIAFVHVEVLNDLGIHDEDLSNSTKVLVVIKFNILFQIIFALCTLVTKISIAFYILRIKNGQKIRMFFSLLMGSVSLATLVIITFLSVTCVPLEHLWNPSVPGRCLNRGLFFPVIYTHLGFTVFSDLYLTASPIIILWKVKIKMWKKIRICGLMSLGLIATVSSVVRANYQVKVLRVDTTLTDDLIYAIIASILEMSSGIIAASIPACLPFMTFCTWKGSWVSLSILSYFERQREESETLNTLPAQGRDKFTTLSPPVSTQDSQEEYIHIPRAEVAAFA